MNCESTVYLNKVFSDLRINSCPLMSSLTADADNFDQHLTFFDATDSDDRGCGCGCHCSCSGDAGLELGNDLNFDIESTEVIISDFNLSDPAGISPCNVTVNGLPVDSLEVFNERYMASTSDLMTKISDCACIERGLPTKGYFLIAGIGGFRTKLTIILRGTVYTCGACKKFRLTLSTKNNVYVNIPGTTTFTVSELCLPCTAGGIAPIINFSFSAKANLLNPAIYTENTSPLCGSLRVTGCLVTEPIADVQVTRQTLFKTSAESMNVLCDELEKCRQRGCGEDDDSNALSLHNRCCEDSGCRPAASLPSCGCASCSCACTSDKDAKPDTDRKNAGLCFQFNGRNGCSF